uniref:Tudor domain containing 7 a n=1 Tax=Mastacembelus armatus TaxID=205130 RepID=A0A3Q3M809_9TELE
MCDSESVKKMLRSVLQSSKTGVSIKNLQSEYRSLCGEIIPLKKLGYPNLEDYLRSIPSVVRLEYRMGDVQCFAAVCKETAHIAELVAKQRSSKKSGRSQVVNCRMRFKPSNPYMHNVRPRSSLRQPSTGGAVNWSANRARSHGGYRGFSASGDYRKLDQSFGSIVTGEHSQPTPQTAGKQCITPDRYQHLLTFPSFFAHFLTEKPPEQASKPSVYDVDVVQTRLTELLEKYCSGLWLSKLSAVYSQMFSQKLNPQVLTDLEKWTHICMVEQPFTTNQADRLIYPPLPPKPCIVPRNNTNNSFSTSSTNSSTVTTPTSSRPSSPEQLTTPLFCFPVPKPRVSPISPLAKPTFIFSPQPVAASLCPDSLHSPVHNPALPPSVVNIDVSTSDGCKNNDLTATTQPHKNTECLVPTSTSPAAASPSAVGSSHDPGCHILPLLKVTFPPTSCSAPPSKSAAVVSDEVRQRIKELLSKYSQGLWAHALPKLFIDTYKMAFPDHILDNLSVLLDICTIEYPIPHDRKKVILYNSSRADMEATGSVESHQSRSHPLPSGLDVLGPVRPPCLVPPSVQYPSVLVTDVKSSNVVTIRYVGESYSDAQEAMEDMMRSFYSQRSTQDHLSSPTVGQLVAVRGEDGDELARAQVLEVTAPNKVKVYFVDYGFSVETSETHLLKLHQEFLSLPFQATNIRLAGLETFSSHPLVISSLEQLAVGKILLMESLDPCQQSEMPVAVLYDTSQDDDININSKCLRSLQDETMNNPLTVNVTYQDVCVTNVCADGTIYCQLPSRGTARLGKLLEKIEAFFISQITSESLVSRPFCGKCCLARYKGKWSRVQITNTHSNRVMEILFIDLGITATVEVTDLREVPPLLLKDFTIIPPQAIKCRLADLTIPEGEWSPEAVLWVKQAVQGSEDCKMKILKLDQHKEDRLVYMYLFIGADGQELDKSINHQLTQSELWQKLSTQNKVTSNNSSVDAGLSALVEKWTLDSSDPNPAVKTLTEPYFAAGDLSLPNMIAKTGIQPLSLPPPVVLPQPGQSMDVFVSVACHPGYFVLQPWQDLHKLVVLMGEMILYYNQMSKSNITTHIQKGNVYAAKIEKNWHRVQVKGILTNGLVSVYELDHGKYELVQNTLIRPLIEEFRQLPFQAITAQLAGVTQQHWSEEAAMLFRNHVERRALVAQVESVQEMSEIKGEVWERRMTVYLVDTGHRDRDLWIHSIMADIDCELSSAA